MAVEKYRAFYPAKVPNLQYDLVDVRDLSQLPAGAILVIQMNEDGTRQVVNAKSNRTVPEQVLYTAASKHLEFKYDG